MVKCVGVLSVSDCHRLHGCWVDWVGEKGNGKGEGACHGRSESQLQSAERAAGPGRSTGWSTGGVSTGGMSTGYVSTGGMSTGGVSTGGMSTGGVCTGGVPTGGVSSVCVASDSFHVRVCRCLHAIAAQAAHVQLSPQAVGKAAALARP
eukprot:222617-Chlamydomonas_euryale.AAC.1